MIALNKACLKYYQQDGLFYQDVDVLGTKEFLFNHDLLYSMGIGKGIRECFLNAIAGVDAAQRQIVKDRKNRVYGYDQVWSVDKSVAAIAHVEPAFRKTLYGIIDTSGYRTLANAMGQVESRLNADDRSLPAKGFGYGQHQASNRIPEPGNHFHAVIANICITASGQQSAVNGMKLFYYREYNQAYFAKDVDQSLLEDRWITARKGNSVCIPAITQEALLKAGFMERYKQVSDYMFEHGWGEMLRGVAYSKTAPPKQTINKAEYNANWDAKAKSIEIKQEYRRSTPIVWAQQQEVDKFVEKIAKHKLAKSGCFSEVELKTEALLASIGQPVRIHQLEQSVDRLLSRFQMLDVYKVRGRFNDAHYISMSPDPELERKLSDAKRVSEAPPKGSTLWDYIKDEVRPIYIVGYAVFKHTPFYRERLDGRTIDLSGETRSKHPKSIEKFLTDLEKTPRSECHKAVLSAIRDKQFRSVNQLLRYAEQVYADTRAPKKALRKNDIVIVNEYEMADRSELKLVEKKVRKAGATLVLRDSYGFSQSQLNEMIKEGQKLKKAQEMKHRQERGQ